MTYPYKLKAEMRKGVVCEELTQDQCYTNYTSWAPGRREIYTCPINYPKDAMVTPWQARLFYEFLQGGPPAELYEAGLAALEAAAEAYQEKVVVAFEFMYAYLDKFLIIRMGPPGENVNNPYNNVARETEVHLCLTLRKDGTVRAEFYNWLKDTRSTVSGDVNKIAKRFVTQLSRHVQLPIGKAA